MDISLSPTEVLEVFVQRCNKTRGTDLDHENCKECHGSFRVLTNEGIALFEAFERERRSIKS
jgi:hypothetical protein